MPFWGKKLKTCKYTHYLLDNKKETLKISNTAKTFSLPYNKKKWNDRILLPRFSIWHCNHLSFASN